MWFCTGRNNRQLPILLDGYYLLEYLKCSAGVVKLVDALDSKSSGLMPMSVRLRPPAPELE